jgi:PAS domain S-box-containing protein
VFHTNFPQLKQRGWVSNLEFELVRKDGTTLAVILSATAVKDASGNYVMNRATIFDITERKRADLELQRSYQTQEVLNALLSISLQDISLEETLLQVIDQVLAIPWLSLEAKGAIFVVEADPITLVLKAQRNLPASFQAQCGLVPFGRCLCGRAAASGKIEFAEHIDDRHETRYEGMTPHGHYCVPIVSAGKVLGVMNLYLKENHRQESKEVEFLNAVANVVGGIIQRKRAEETRARLVAILEQTSDFVAIANAPDCHILYMNPAGRKMIGVGQEENLTPLVISDTHPEWANQMFRDEIIPTAIRDGLWRGDCAFRHRDGQEIPVLMVVLAHKSPAGDVVHFSTISRDISERKLAEEQLLKAHAELTQNEAHLRKTLQELQASHEALKETELQLIQAAKLEAVGTLAAGVAHEVKNPLQTMLLGLDYLANNLRGLNDTTTTVLGDMRDAVTRANVIVRELLQLSAAKDFEPREEDLNALVERSLWLINHEIIALQINVVRKLGTDLPRVLLDRSKMEQVFLNLFHNALQAMSQGGVLTVTTRHRRFGEDLKLSGPGFAQFQPGELVVIAEVQDTGKGIPEDHLPKIFGPFFTTKPTGVGTGLGLSVVKKIMDLHGGAIDVRNAPRGGVVVTLMLRTEPEKTL